MIKLPKVLPAPLHPSSIPKEAKWLSGEGAGSWFSIKTLNHKNQYMIKRFSPDGQFECEGVFVPEIDVDLREGYLMTYPSHCSVVSIIQGTKKIRFVNINTNDQ